MPNFDFNGIVGRFQALAVRSANDQTVDSELADLIAQVSTREREKIQQVRGRLRILLAGLEAPEPALHDKLSDPANQKQRAFYKDAIAQLGALIEGGA